MTRALLVAAFAGLGFGLLSSLAGNAVLAGWLWAAGTLPVVIALLASIVRKFLSGRLGVDVVAFVAMSAGLLAWHLCCGRLNALRALGPGHAIGRKALPAASVSSLRAEHQQLDGALDRLRAIADALDEAEASRAAALIGDADQIVTGEIVAHERADESGVYPQLAKFLLDPHGLEAMSRAHREIMHQARLLTRLAHGLAPNDIDYLIRDAQRVI